MKKVTSLVLVLILLISFVQVSTANAEETQLAPLPKIGQVIFGFRAEEIGYMEFINADTVLFEHVKTGAKLFYIRSKDIERSFEIAFRTPAVDDTGVNHILEHISISGSEKYPLRNVLFTILNQTYSTFVNAYTSQNFTAYPVSSMSEAQLLKLAEVYLDCVYNPLVYTDKNIFLREAWRYEMTDADAPLVINGTVYNEMKGALGDMSTAAFYNVLDALFPNSVQANISGGDPNKIKYLTYERLLRTHQKYYHPSNSLMILYGDLDYTRFLKMIDEEFLSKYIKKDVRIDYGKVAPFSQKTEGTYKFPVTANTNTENSARIDYAYALTDVSEEELIGLSILASVLGNDSSSLQQAFRERQIGGRVTVTFIDSFVQPVFMFTAEGTDESRKDEFKAIVDDAISDLAANGCDKDLVKATISAVLLSYSTLTEARNLGVNLSMSISTLWANTGSVNYFNNLLKNIRGISEKIDEDYLEGLAEKYILKNNHAALVTTVLEPGLAEKLAIQQQTYLAGLKASMSEQEIEKIINDTKAYNEWNSRETDPAVVDKLQAVKVADLPVETKIYTINEEKLADGIRMLSAAADVAETGYTAILLDTSSVPVEKLHYLQLYTSLLGRLDTKLYSKEKLSTLLIRYLNGPTFNLSAIPKGDWNEFMPVLVFSWMGLMGEYDEQTDLLKEVMLNTEFDDVDTILGIVKQQISSIKNMITSNPVNLLASRNLANLNACYNYQSYLSGLEYYFFLVQVEQLLQVVPEIILAELESMHQLILNRTNMITMFAGNESYMQKYEDGVKKLINALPANPATAQDYTQIPGPARKEGIAINTPVQYNMISASYEDMGTSFSGKFIPIGLVVAENYITPMIRFGYGAYDNIVNFSSTSFMLLSYRDPNIRETFDVYRGLPEFVRNFDITQKELDRYILKAFSTYSAVEGELSGALNAMNNYLMGNTAEDKLRILQEIKSTTVEDLKNSAEMFEQFLDNGAWSTIGSAEMIEANMDLYDSVISFGQQEEPTITRAQFFELILPGVPEPVEVAKQVGLLLGDGQGNYNENEKLTKEQLAVFLCRLAALNGIRLITGERAAIADEADISSWAIDSVQALVALDIMKLDDNGNFNPKDEVTVSLIQAIVNEFMMKLSGVR